MPGNDKAENDLPKGLSKPAQRALVRAGYTRLEQFSELNETDVSELHGMGPKAVGLIRDALAAKGQTFANGA